jgi:predicted ester cyclase
MSAAQEVAGRVIEAVNAHDIEALRSLYAPEARTRRPGWPQDGGPAELIASYEMDFACVPDINFGPVSTVADGPHVVTEMRITGTNTGPTILGDFGKALLGADVDAVPPTGRSIDLPAIFVHEVGDDHVVAERQYWGLLEFLVQIGVVGG